MKPLNIPRKVYLVASLVGGKKESSETRWLLFAIDGTSFFCVAPLARLVPTEPIKMDCPALI
jgi:hypothetical protein